MQGTDRHATVFGLGLSADDISVLDIARHFFRWFAQSGTDGWTTSFSAAERHFPGRPASDIALAVFKTVKAMGLARRSVFIFSNPRCAGCARKVSSCERHFICTLTALRDNRTSTAHVNAMLLCEGRDCAPFLEAMAELSALLSSRTPRSTDA